MTWLGTFYPSSGLGTERSIEAWYPLFCEIPLRKFRDACKAAVMLNEKGFPIDPAMVRKYLEREKERKTHSKDAFKPKADLVQHYEEQLKREGLVKRTEIVNGRRTFWYERETW